MNKKTVGVWTVLVILSLTFVLAAEKGAPVVTEYKIVTITSQIPPPGTVANVENPKAGTVLTDVGLSETVPVDARGTYLSTAAAPVQAQAAIEDKGTRSGNIVTAAITPAEIKILQDSGATFKVDGQTYYVTETVDIFGKTETKLTVTTTWGQRWFGGYFGEDTTSNVPSDKASIITTRRTAEGLRVEAPSSISNDPFKVANAEAAPSARGSSTGSSIQPPTQQCSGGSCSTC